MATSEHSVHGAIQRGHGASRVWGVFGRLSGRRTAGLFLGRVVSDEGQTSEEVLLSTPLFQRYYVQILFSQTVSHCLKI